MAEYPFNVSVTSELVMSCRLTSQGTSLGTELIHADSWESSGFMVTWCVVVNLVDGLRVVNDVMLVSILLDDRLDSLDNVVVDVFANSSGRGRLGDLGGHHMLTIPELLLLGSKSSL